MTEEVFCNRNWQTHWNVKSSAGGAQWPAGPYHLQVKSWLRPMTLILTVRGNKKLCFHFKSAWVSAHTQDMLQWSEKLQDTTPSNFAITGPDCCRLLKQLPQGDQSNLVYSSLSIHSSNLAQVITTSLSSPKSSPEVLSRKSYLWLSCLPFGHWSKQTQHQYARGISWMGLCSFSRCWWPSAACSPRTHQSH